MYEETFKTHARAHNSTQIIKYHFEMENLFKKNYSTLKEVEGSVCIKEV